MSCLTYCIGGRKPSRKPFCYLRQSRSLFERLYSLNAANMIVDENRRLHSEPSPDQLEASGLTFSDPVFPLHTTKYFAAGWCTTIAEVLCSGSSRKPLVRRTPTFFSGSSNWNSFVWSSRFGHAG